MARRMRLTDAGIDRLKAERTEYTVWDTRIAGFGVRVRPSGYRSYVYHRDERKFTLGPTMLKGVDVARQECAELQARPPGVSRTGPEEVVLFRDFVADPWRQTCYDRYKSSSKRGARNDLNNQLLPAFGKRPLHRITRADIVKWFDHYSLTAPSGANHALGTLHQILNHAVNSGCIETNPARGLPFNPRRRLTRFLSQEEVRCLHRVLDRQVTKRPALQPQADIIRLLLLTGCRRGEVLALQWQEVHGDTLHLVDSKTGPRKVFLNAAARGIIERQPRSGSRFVFPSPVDPSRPRSCNSLTRVWYPVRKQAGIADVRLHDLRHTFASHAVMKGVPLPVVAKLLGHSDVRMTLRYAHVADRDIEAAAERIGIAIAGIMEAGESVGSDSDGRA